MQNEMKQSTQEWTKLLSFKYCTKNEVSCGLRVSCGLGHIYWRNS